MTENEELSTEEFARVSAFGVNMIKFHAMPVDAQRAYVTMLDELKEALEYAPEGAKREMIDDPMAAVTAYKVAYKKVDIFDDLQSKKIRVAHGFEAFDAIRGLVRLSRLEFGQMLKQKEFFGSFRYTFGENPVMFIRHLKDSERLTRDSENGNSAPVDDDDIIISVGIAGNRSLEYTVDSRYFELLTL